MLEELGRRNYTQSTTGAYPNVRFDARIHSVS